MIKLINGLYSARERENQPTNNCVGDSFNIFDDKYDANPLNYQSSFNKQTKSSQKVMSYFGRDVGGNCDVT